MRHARAKDPPGTAPVVTVGGHRQRGDRPAVGTSPMKLLAGACVTSVTVLMAVPILFASGDTASGCGTAPPSGEEVVDDGSPSILGPAALTAADIAAWWTSKGKGQPPRLTIAINDLIAAYLAEGAAEGVRGDLAFAQAVLETGWFTNSDTSINNFAGIAHYDGTASGTGFSSAVVGVRAQVQLLKKYAAGNDTPLASPDVSPNAGAHATTWAGLATRWATAPDYWTKLSSIYESMLAGRAGPDLGGLAGACPVGVAAVVGDYALPVEARWYAEHPQWFTKPHHDYPAADIPVPTGTPIFAAAGGTVVKAPAGGACGLGVIVNSADGVTWLYCHGSDGGQVISPGDQVVPGQLLMHSASTGNSTGPHLHFGIRVDGQNRCPQPFMVAVAEGSPITPQSLPTSGCSY